MENTRPNEGTFVQKMKQFSKFFKSQYALSSWQQFTVLLQMMMTKIFRNRIVLWIQFFHHFGCGLFIGLIFLNSANDGKRMFDHLKFCMGSIFFVVYTQIMVPILSCKLIFCYLNNLSSMCCLQIRRNCALLRRNVSIDGMDWRLIILPSQSLACRSKSFLMWSSQCWFTCLLDCPLSHGDSWCSL